MKVPRWLKLQEQIDYYSFVLKSMLENEKKRSPIEKIIDLSTGFQEKKIEEAKKIIKKIEKLKKEFYDQPRT